MQRQKHHRKEAWAPDAFSELGHRLIDQLTEHLRQSLSCERSRVYPAISPEDMLHRWPGAFRENGDADFAHLVSRLLGDSNNLQDPRYIGHQCCPPMPISALCDLVGSLINNGSAIFEMGPVNVAMEKQLIDWMCRLAGFGDLADGVFTHGGSAGNLTALLAARQAMAGFDVWTEGVGAGGPMAVLVSEQCHYSVRRAVAMMGLGESAIYLVDTDDRHHITRAGLEQQMDQALTDGRKPFALVTNACSTASGAYDDLQMANRFCQDHHLWHHVDGAHGAGVLLSPKYRGQMTGIDQVDSLVWDAHKMLMVPALATAVLFRDGKNSFTAFRQRADYLFESTDHAWYDYAHRTIECTKAMLGLKLYLPLRVLGVGIFREHIETTHDLAQSFATLIEKEPDFELALVPESNIVCFRYTPNSSQDLDQLQVNIRRKILADGRFYIVQTRFRDAIWLRVTIIHPLTDLTTLQALLQHIRSLDDSIAARE